MHRVVAWLAVAALAACEDKKPTPSIEPPAVKDGLTIDDVHQPTRAILAVGTKGETSWRITAATDALSCEDLEKAYPERPAPSGGTHVDFWLRQPLTSDGASGLWGVRSASITDAQGGRGMTTRGALVEGVEASSEHVKVTGLELACSDGDRVITYTGALLAKNCGRVLRPEDDHPQTELGLSVAGQRIEVHGATLMPRDKRHHLRLTRAPHRCGSVFTEGYDFFVDVALEGEPPRVAFASLSGDRFPEDPSGSKGKETFTVTFEDAPGDAPGVTITLSGALDLGGFALKLDGKVTAQRCY